jgi:autotransporter-like protein
VGIYARRPRQHHVVRPLSDLERDAECVQRVGRAVAQPQRRATDHQLVARRDRCRSRELDRPRQRQEAHDLAVRLGWQHEFAETGRPITAAFAGAPGNSFTLFGATPARDAAVVGLQATTQIAAATQVYLRYDRGVGGGTDNHAVNVGVRMSW